MKSRCLVGMFVAFMFLAVGGRGLALGHVPGGGGLARKQDRVTAAPTVGRENQANAEWIVDPERFSNMTTATLLLSGSDRALLTRASGALLAAIGLFGVWSEVLPNLAAG
jgi:hypothetical protein